MDKWVIGTTDEEIDAAIARAANEPDGPAIASMEYRADANLDLFLIVLEDGRRLSVPRENLQAVHAATAAQAAHFELNDFRDTIWWPDVDEGVTLDGLLHGRYGSKKWMEQWQGMQKIAA